MNPPPTKSLIPRPKRPVPPDPTPNPVRAISTGPSFVGAQARKQRRVPGRANTPSPHTLALAKQRVRRDTLTVDAPKGHMLAASVLPARPDPPPIPPPPSTPYPELAAAGWATERAGNPLYYLEGWGIDPTHHTDLVALRVELLREPRHDEWTLSLISPVSPTFLASRSYYSPRSTSPAQARKHQATEDRKATFLAAVSGGATVRQATRMIGMSDTTIMAWRRRDIDFNTKYQTVMSGRGFNASHYDGTFIGARKHFFGYDSYTHHVRIIEAIEKTPPGGITMILLPPEAGKTSTLEDYCCFRLGNDPNFRILYVSETAGTGSQAQKVLSTVKDRMTDPDYQDPNAPHTRIPEFIAQFGPFHDAVEDNDKPWNQNYIKISKQSGRRDYSLQTCGWKSRIYGARCDMLVFDDVQSDQSLGQTETMLRTIRKTFLTRPGKEGRTIIIGQMLGVGCLYERMIEEGMIDEIVIIPALDEDGNTYCPEMWPVEALAQRRKKVGEDVWWAAYMQQPHLADDATFTDELLEGAKNDTLFACRRPDLVTDGTPGGSWKIIAGLDPALGGGNALHIAAVNNTHYRVLDQFIDFRLMRNEDILNRIKEACRYHFSELIVEKNSQQRGLARDDRLREIAERFGFRIVEHETGNNKWDFNYGVAGMAGSFVRREVVIPWADEIARKRMTPLLDELRSWRPNLPPKLQKQDMVMSMWFCWLWWRKNNQISNADTNQWQGQGTPWRPGDMSSRWATKRAS